MSNMRIIEAGDFDPSTMEKQDLSDYNRWNSNDYRYNDSTKPIIVRDKTKPTRLFMVTPADINGLDQYRVTADEINWSDVGNIYEYVGQNVNKLRQLTSDEVEELRHVSLS